MKIKPIFIYAGVSMMSIAMAFVIFMLIFDSSDEPTSFTKHYLNSSVLGEEREFLVKLPENFHPDSEYPTVYVIGGNSITFNIGHELDVLSRAGFNTDVILVGLPNPNQEIRQRDITPPGLKQDLDDLDSPNGKANIYFEYIKTEVVPLVEEIYPASDSRIIVGHSREGLAAMYSLIFDPELFAGRVCLSPAFWREDDKFIYQFRDFLDHELESENIIFMSMGTEENEKMKNAFNKMISTINASGSELIIGSYYSTPDANHQSNPFLSASRGIVTVLNQID